MKIEKVNENQIRCTLTKDDLADRQLKISELAYGTEKAKSLFRDMMQQASFEFGFDAEDIPLMIEAIPLSTDCIVLIITKVEDPEELDTRFSKFAPTTEEEAEELQEAAPVSEGADDILDLFKRIHAETKKALEGKEEDDFVPLAKALSKKKSKEHTQTEVTINLTKLYVFDNFDVVSRAARVLRQYYTGINSLYKDEANGLYYLMASKAEHTPEQFNKICNVLSEYGKQKKCSAATEAFFQEHCRIILQKEAMQKIAEVV